MFQYQKGRDIEAGTSGAPGGAMGTRELYPGMTEPLKMRSQQLRESVTVVEPSCGLPCSTGVPIRACSVPSILHLAATASTNKCHSHSYTFLELQIWTLGETYWSKVAETFNKTTPVDRKREMHHLKGHWHKTTKKVSFFNGCYIQLRDAYASGRSDDKLMDQVLDLYRSYQGHHFTYTHWWKAMHDLPKWNVHVSSYGQALKKATQDLNRSAPLEPMQRPVGIKRAKKRKEIADAVAVEVKEHLKIFIEAQATQKEDLEAMKEL
ncbi:hypothetical protein E2562_002027 [Oryza meyeriana var. granulata]|uniref:No apical meristem-associated C-terminal domain-containing protein n=1 Tax=Oryza meyeriana var. granulata TaxID=110450 RepID=A0A6G1C3Y8_9ORYZ|nr:hypothetical protein E2562_002027 [Oryza meyeriana var. granulata]